MTPDIKIKHPKRRNNTILRKRTLADVLSAMRFVQETKETGPRFSSINGSRDFCATDTIGEYVNMLTDGWCEGVEGVEGLDGLSTDRADKIAFVRSPGGAFPVVPAYIAGAPDSMLRPTPQPADSVRGLTLVVDFAFNCGVEARTALTYAQSVMRLIAWLQAEQIEVSVYAVAAMEEGQTRMLYTVPIREAGDILQPERIASCVHPSFLRRGWFALAEREYIENRLPGTSCCKHGYARSTLPTGDELRQALPDAFSVILLPKVGRGDPEKAVRESVTLKLRNGEPL